MFLSFLVDCPCNLLNNVMKNLTEWEKRTNLFFCMCSLSATANRISPDSFCWGRFPYHWSRSDLLYFLEKIYTLLAMLRKLSDRIFFLDWLLSEKEIMDRLPTFSPAVLRLEKLKSPPGWGLPSIKTYNKIEI